MCTVSSDAFESCVRRRTCVWFDSDAASKFMCECANVRTFVLYSVEHLFSQFPNFKLYAKFDQHFTIVAWLPQSPQQRQLSWRYMRIHLHLFTLEVLTTGVHKLMMISIRWDDVHAMHAHCVTTHEIRIQIALAHRIRLYYSNQCIKIEAIPFAMMLLLMVMVMMMMIGLNREYRLFISTIYITILPLPQMHRGYRINAIESNLRDIVP